MYEKLIKDGQVAVLYSPGYGAGWYSWNKDKEDAEGLLFDREIVEAVLAEKRDLAEEIAERKYSDGYYSAGKLRVCWLPEGTIFRIKEYDGSEAVITLDNEDYLRA